MHPLYYALTPHLYTSFLERFNHFVSYFRQDGLRSNSVQGISERKSQVNV